MRMRIDEINHAVHCLLERQLVEHNSAVLLQACFRGYNLRNDISERNNLAMTEKRKLAELMGDLRTWKKKIGAQLPVFNPNYNFEKEQNWIFSKSSTQK